MLVAQKIYFNKSFLISTTLRKCCNQTHVVSVIKKGFNFHFVMVLLMLMFLRTNSILVC